MTGKPKPVDPWPIQATFKPDSVRRHPGLSKETVDAIYDQVLGVPSSDRTPKGQFSKGNSGNPKGRPKRDAPSSAIPPSALAADSLSAIVLRQGARKVKAQTDQGEVELTLVEAAMTKIVREAVGGNTGHSRTFMQLVSRAETEEAKRKRELFRHWSAVKEQATQLYTQAQQGGEEPPLSVHPDDIELHTDGTVSIVGPTTAEEIAVMRYTHGMVDYHIVNIAYEKWVERRSIRLRRRRVEGCSYAELSFWDEQNDLPPRLKMTAEEVTKRLQSYAGFSGRTLHGFLREKARQHGLDVPQRESRVPLIIPTAILEFAKANKISVRRLLPMWLAANSKPAEGKLDEL